VAGIIEVDDEKAEVQIEHAVRGVTQEVWVSSTTGAVRAVLPLQAPLGQ
jgi:hypothetical protein